MLAGGRLLVAERDAGPRAGTSPSISSSSERNDDQERRRARPRPHLRSRGVARPERRGWHLVDGDTRGVDQAHRRGEPRTCVKASACRSRSSPTKWSAAARRSGSTRFRWPKRNHSQGRRCATCTGSSFLLYAEASPELDVLPVGAEEYDQGLRPRPAPRPDARRASQPRAATARTCTTRWPCCSAGRSGDTSPQPLGTASTRRPGLPQPGAARPVPARGDRADR